MSPDGVRRFDDLRERLANFQLAPLRSVAVVALSLVLFDLVLRIDDLRRLWGVLARPLAWKGRAFVSWEGEDGRWQRRYLSSRSVIAALAVDEWPAFETAAAAVDEALRCADPRWRGGYSFGELLKDGAAWAHANVSPHLALSVVGVCPLACLPDSTLARESSGARLAPLEEPERTEGSSHGGIPPSGQGTDLWRAVDAALTCQEGTRLYRRRTIVERLSRILPQFGSMSEGEYLVVSWFIELVRTGTPTTSPITPGTATDYIRRIGPGLLARIDVALAALDEPACWVMMYSDLIEQADEGSRHKAHAALTAFHDFAVAHVEAPRLRTITSVDVSVEPPPRADRLWPHEVGWIREQLARATGAPVDVRFCRQMNMLFELLLATGARSSDILALRMEDVRYFGEVLILSIDPRPSDGSIKSLRSRRQVRIEGEEVVSAARQWTALRQAELASATSLFFGCPDGTHLVWRRVASLVGIGRLIKEASGVRLLGPHVLRHTRATEAAESTEPTPCGQRQFHAFAASLGHGADVTTHRDYNHSWDWVLFRQLEKLQRDLATSWDSEAGWLGITSAALRKRASRSGLDRAAFVASALEEAVADRHVPDVHSGFSFVERTAPEWPRPGEGLCFRDALAVCRDAANDVPVDAIAARTLVEPRIVRRVLRRLVAEGRVSASMEESDARLRSRVREAMDRLRRIADFSRLGQPKMAPLVAYSVRDTTKPMLLRASLAWERVRRGSYVSLERPEDVRELLEFLHDAGVSVEQLVAVIDSNDRSGDSGSGRLERSVLARFADAFHQAPRLHYVRPRSGRPRAYLHFMERGQKGQPPAAVSMAGVQALMLAASAWRHLLEEAS
jgi:integrase